MSRTCGWLNFYHWTGSWYIAMATLANTVTKRKVLPLVV